MHSWLRFNTWTWCVVVSLLGAMDSPQTASGADSEPSRRLAIVIGVNTYRPNSGLGPLQHAVKDASRLSAVLRKSGYTVIEMTHDVAREQGKEVLAPYLVNIRDQISGVLETPNLGKQDSVLITLHGHGVHFDLTETVTKNGKQIEQKTPKFFFCPADASINRITSVNEIKDRNFLLPLDELYELLGSCNAATKLLIVDACRNDPSSPGTFREGNLQSQTMPKIPPPPGGMAALLSCRESQRAVEDKDLGDGGQGVFTHFLIRGLEGKADLPLDERQPADGVITLAELAAYTANNTYSFVLKKYPGVKQSPEIKGEFDVNLPLVKLSTEDPDYLRGVALWHGLGTKIDQPEAVALLKKVADKGHPLAMAYVAGFYLNGEQVKQDTYEAGHWSKSSLPHLKKLADEGHSEAQRHLGYFYDTGLGGEIDDRLAVMWYRKAAAQNDVPAKNYLGLMYDKGEGVTRDPVEAVKWYREAAEQNDAIAQSNLGLMYAKGNGVTKDPVEAVKWYRKAAEQNDSYGQFSLGRAYSHGEGVTEDAAEAERWFRKALVNPAADANIKKSAQEELNKLGKKP